MLRAYYAGPIGGLSVDEVRGRYAQADILLPDIEWVLPIAAAEMLEQADPEKVDSSGNPNIPEITPKAITKRDQWLLSTCDVLLVNLTNETPGVSIGSMFELAWAFAGVQHTVVIMNEGGIYDHAFIKEASDVVFSDIAGAFSYMQQLADISRR